MKVVNNNPYDVTLYASVMDFSAQGEEGQGKLTPIVRTEGESARMLASWIDVSPDSFVVPREQSREVPFTVRIPQDAPPGGHYAAILIGTAPAGGASNGPTISVSSLISSLLFVRIKGDIIEKGYIQSFRADRTVYLESEPEVRFALKFTNNGTVHVQPRGDIRITDIWGEVATIPINQDTAFGNVLPGGTRVYDASWRGSAGWYKAVATVTFGDEEHQNESGAASFIIIPLRPLLVFGAGLIALIGIIALLVRAYVRRSLAATMRSLRVSRKHMPRADVPPETRDGGVIDLRHKQ